MNRRTLAVLAALTAWWGLGENVAHAQTWRLGTYGLPQGRRTAIGPYRPQLDANPPVNLQPGVTPFQPDGSYQPGLVGPGATTNQPTVLQTGHPVTHFNYQQYFPLGYGTTSGTNIGITGITGIGGVYGYGQGTTGIQQGFYPNNLNTLQRGRLGVYR